MHKKSRITLDIPDPDYFEDDEPHVYIPVRSGVVDSGIELLQCMLGQWKNEEGSESDDQVWDQLMVSAAQMLAGLLTSWTDYYHGNQARKLVDQIAWFCHWKGTPPKLETLQGAPGHPDEETALADADVVPALLSLHELSQRRLAERKERKARQEQQAAALTAEERDMLAALKDPHLFQNVVDSLPAGGARLTLKQWGMLHGAYACTDETERAIQQDLQALKAAAAEETSPAADSAEQPETKPDVGWDF
jgi:hypothetical protein